MASGEAGSAIRPLTTEATVISGKPSEQLEVSEPSDVQGDNAHTENSQANIVYPTGLKLWLSIISILLTVIFVGLDMTIVAVAVPTLTNQYKTVNDIGWYSAAYGLFQSSFTFFFSKMYTHFDTKNVYLASICLFQLGSLLCTVAPASSVFIFGRAVAGLGGAGLATGAGTIVSYSFPLQKRPLWGSVIAAVQTLSMVAAPLIGGALVDAWSWRACFGINLPFGALAFGMTAYAFNNPIHNPDTKLPLKQKIKRMDLLGSFFFVPGIVCLLMALQWGGIRYGWNNPRIIALLVVFAVLISVFGYIQYREQDKATLPPRILKQRSVIAGAWFSACCSGILAVTENYIAIYFQGVRGFSATKSGALGIPMIVGIGASALAAGILTSAVGYYYPFMFATSIMTPIATGLLTTTDLDESLAKVLGLLAFLGIAVGLGIQAPVVAVQTVLPPKDVPIGMAMTGFGGGIGTALFLAASAALFQNRLIDEISPYSPGTNVTVFEDGGLADVKKYVGPARLKDVLFGYDKAVTQTFYIPVALSISTIIASLAMEQKSVKQKKS